MNTQKESSDPAFAVANGQSLNVYGEAALNTINAERDGGTIFPGRQSFGLAEMNPNSNVPPPTDHGVLEPIRYSFWPRSRVYCQAAQGRPALYFRRPAPRANSGAFR